MNAVVECNEILMSMSCSQKIRLFISPCPNDTFAFYALLNGKVDCCGLDFEVAFEDIETLNERAMRGDGDIVKASIVVAPAINYELLSSGAALGRGNGPVVVRGGAENRVVALPGKYTTANNLFDRFFAGYTKKYVVFSDVASLVERGQAELGVLIHEGRFTFAQRGLEFVADLGQMWERSTSLPLPLGGIFASLELPPAVRRKVERTIKESVEWAMSHRAEPMAFVRSHARELSESVLLNHIDYFVNNYTINIGVDGAKAISMLAGNDIL